MGHISDIEVNVIKRIIRETKQIDTNIGYYKKHQEKDVILVNLYNGQLNISLSDYEKLKNDSIPSIEKEKILEEIADSFKPQKFLRRNSISFWIEVAGIPLLTISLLAQIYTFSLSTKHDKKKVAIELWDNWGTLTNDQAFKNSIDRLMNDTISSEEWKRIVLTQDLKEDDKENNDRFLLKQDCISLLNLYEKMAIIYRYDIGNQEIIEAGFKEVFKDHYKSLSQFKHEYNLIHHFSSSKEGHWFVVETLADEWRN